MARGSVQLELDHVFIAVEPNAPEAEALEQFGLVIGTGLSHKGQGTRNVRFFFGNAYLELLWIDDPNEIQLPGTRRTGLWERCRWRETGACPFGAAFRVLGNVEMLPFRNWLYRPEFLPSGSPIPIAANSANLAEPLLFVVPGGKRPSDFTGDRRQPLTHQQPLCEITAVRTTLPGAGPFSHELGTIAEQGVLQFSRGGSYHIELEFDGGQASEARFFGPALPLSVRW